MDDHSPVGGSLAGGFVLPLVLVVMSALLVLAVMALSLSSGGRRVTGMWLDRRQAELALDAALEEVCAILDEACANDQYLVVREPAPSNRDAGRLFIVQARRQGSGWLHQPLPLFSSSHRPPATAALRVPDVGGLTGDAAVILPKPWMQPIRLEWIAVRDQQGEVVARYAYWVEDLQAMLDPRVAGNAQGEGGGHRRVAHPFPAAGLNDQPLAAGNPAMNQIALWALDPDVAMDGGSERAQGLIAGRKQMVSPGSSLAVAGIQPPLARFPPSLGDARGGRLVDPWAAALESQLVVGIQPYDEQPRVALVEGIASGVVGRPKINLNGLLALEDERAVGLMADWISHGLPDFKQRAGGFPEDYLKTLAASALDYADRDGEPTRLPGVYQGMDSHPLLSEVVLHLHYRRWAKLDGRWVQQWTLRLFAELWNPTSQPVRGGRARLSYEVNLRPTAVGMGPPPLPFDDPALLLDARQSSHQLERVDGRFYTPAVEVELRPDEYRFYQFARVDYRIDCTPQIAADGQPWVEEFDLIEPLEEARGLSLLWNGRTLQRLHRILRDPYGVGGFRTDRARKTAKACIPGLNYGGYGAAVNNPGDPRMAGYFRHAPLGENAYPENLSPHRRNIRRRNIYDKDPDPLKTRHYGRVMPSQWPDGGHDSPVGDFRVTTSDAVLPTDAEKWPLSEVPEPLAEHAPQRISNAGRFFSASELGRIHDPLMWTPAYPDLVGLAGSGAEDSALLLGRRFIWQRPTMPARRMQWPEVSLASRPSPDHGGGNTLRIGRPEHPRFEHPGWRASRLLDLFHCGISTSQDRRLREGPVQRIEGQVNVNTASREVLRCLVAGRLAQDPALCRVTDWTHDTRHRFAPRTEPLVIGLPASGAAERIAAAIIRGRPYASPSQLAEVTDEQGRPVFGNPALHGHGRSLQWSDAAAEEEFARIYEAATVRSRNFRIWMIGQKVTGKPGALEVQAQSRRAVTLFVDPGERARDGRLIPENQKIRILHVQEY